jgi:hypothetical protein
MSTEPEKPAEKGKPAEEGARAPDRFAFWTAVVGLITGCVGLGATGLTALRDLQPRDDTPRTLTVYHHAPFWEQLVADVIRKSEGSALGTKPGEKIRVPEPRTGPAEAKAEPQGHAYTVWLPGVMLAVALVSFAFLIRNRRA